MPEDNFEQQARRKAEEFSMSPKPEVWLHVQKAIAPRERRRRGLLLWWWLPFLITACIVPVLLITRKKEMPVRDAAGVVSGKQNDTAKGERQPVADIKTTPQKESNSAIGGTNSNTIVKQLLKPEPENTHDRLATDMEQQTSLFSNRNNAVDEAIATTGLKPDADTNVSENNIRKAITPAAETPALTVKGDSITQTSVTSDSSFEKQAMVSDTGTAEKKDLFVTKAIVTKTTGRKRNDIKKQWQAGIFSEVGLASWGKDILTNEAQTNKSVESLPLANSVAIDSFFANTSELQQTKNGLDINIGLDIRRELQNHFYINSQLGYRYQQYTIYNLRKPVIPQTSLTSSNVYLVNKNDYHTHFLTLAVSAGRYFFSDKKHSFAAEVGLDNALLLTIKQGSGKSQSNFFSARNLIARDFYRWQPHLFISLPFNWQSAGKVRLAVSPFARFGLHAFQKDGNDYRKNHLVSTGLQAVYFFK